MNLPNIAAYTDDKLLALRLAVAQEQERRNRIAEAPQRAAALAQQHAADIADEPARDLADIAQHEAVGPGGRVVIDGTEWINNTAAWLSPHAAGPEHYPLGWRLAVPPEPGGDDVQEWAPGIDVQAGDLLTYDGTVYKVLQSHRTQADWLPPQLAALYAIA